MGNKGGVPKGTNTTTRMPGMTGENREILPETPLTPLEQKFVAEYIKTSKGGEALKATGVQMAEHMYKKRAYEMLQKPNIQAEINRVMQEIHEKAVADGIEVMKYFTDVMRGEVKDQFGLEASLSERTRAAQELAKRTVDLENRRAGDADTIVQIKLDWQR